ncbi:MAG: hypothetical protein WCI18_03340 [Pseudomonadota bacterium]
MKKSCVTRCLLSAVFLAFGQAQAMELHGQISTQGGHEFIAQGDVASQIIDLKSQIVAIALANQTNLKNSENVRAQLDPLVARLGALEAKTFEEEKALKVGVWQQLWTDDADDKRADNFFQKVDRTNTYQVVFEDGVFYNVSEIETVLGRFTGFLRGNYEAMEPRFNLEFTDLKVRRGGVETSSEQGGLFSFVEAAKLGQLKGLFQFPGERRYPNGPVGAKGYIETVFIDEEIRIDVGANLADGVRDLFVLVRAQ